MVGNHTLPNEILSNCDGFVYCFGKWANEVTLGTFWAFALLGFAIILFMATSRLGTKRAFGYGSFVGLIGSLWLGTLGFMSWWISSAFIITGIIGLAIMIMSEN